MPQTEARLWSTAVAAVACLLTVSCERAPAINSTIKVDPHFNTILVDAKGRLFWNGHGVTEAQLDGLLKQSTSMAEEPELRLVPTVGASYPAVDRVLTALQKAGVTTMGFVGNEAYSK